MDQGAVNHLLHSILAIDWDSPSENDIHSLNKSIVTALSNFFILEGSNFVTTE